LGLDHFEKNPTPETKVLKSTYGSKTTTTTTTHDI
jgi:hypothetical protein